MGYTKGNNVTIMIPLYIKSLCPEYKIYFRHYRELSGQETVCYAIANNNN